MRKLGLPVVLLMLLVTSCESEVRFKTVTHQDKYSLSIPSFLKKVDDLNEAASLQYCHLAKEFYVLVIDEPIYSFEKALKDNQLTEVYSNDLDGYTDLVIDGVKDMAEVSNLSEIRETTIHSLPTNLVNLNAKVDGLDVYYAFAFARGKKTYYQVATWTLASYKSQYEAIMSKVVHSLKELN